MDVDQAVSHLLEGGIVAYPTETVWGLGALNKRPEALAQVIKLKGREVEKGMSLLVANIAMAEEVAFISDQRIRRFLQIVWPGPLTVVLRAKPVVDPLVHGGTGEVGLRLSCHHLVQKLMVMLSEPLTTTSANRSGHSPARSRAELTWLPTNVGILGREESEGIKPSTVIRIEGEKVFLLREGAIAREELARLARSCDLAF